MGIREKYRSFERWLEGWPGLWLSVLLLMVAAFLVYVALHGRPMEKAVVASWVILP